MLPMVRRPQLSARRVGLRSAPWAEQATTQLQGVVANWIKAGDVVVKHVESSEQGEAKAGRTAEAPRVVEGFGRPPRKATPADRATPYS